MSALTVTRKQVSLTRSWSLWARVEAWTRVEDAPMAHLLIDAQVAILAGKPHMSHRSETVTKS